jgi:hypothetical protein
MLELAWHEAPQPDPPRVQVSITQQGEPYYLPIDVIVRAGSQQRVHRLQIARAHQDFVLDSPGRPTDVQLDPGHRLLLWREEFGPPPDTPRRWESTRWRNWFDSDVRWLMPKYGVKGVAVAAVQAHAVSWVAGYGIGPNGDSVTGETRFDIGGLRQLATAADRAGGLGPLEGVHERFTPLVAALSVLECASLAEAISTGTLPATAVYPWLAMLLLVDGALFLGPLLVFTDKLWAGRMKGVGIYMGLAARYVTEFEAKWTGANVPGGEPLLGTPDLQSLADLANAVSVVKRMRWITAGPRLLTLLTLAAIAPLAPLLLFQYPIAELAQKFFLRLVGL